jgi:hypothetical protein
VALANHRWLALADGQVTFRLKDYRQGHRRTTMTLEAGEFIRRFPSCPIGSCACATSGA